MIGAWRVARYLWLCMACDVLCGVVRGACGVWRWIADEWGVAGGLLRLALGVW